MCVTTLQAEPHSPDAMQAYYSSIMHKVIYTLLHTVFIGVVLSCIYGLGLHVFTYICTTVSHLCIQDLPIGRGLLVSNLLRMHQVWLLPCTLNGITPSRKPRTLHCCTLAAAPRLCLICCVNTCRQWKRISMRVCLPTKSQQRKRMTSTPRSTLIISRAFQGSNSSLLSSFTFIL